MYFHHPEYTCKRECDNLKYPSMCYTSCEDEHNQKRYNFKKELPDFVPSTFWYGLTSTHRDVFYEHSGIYLSLVGHDDYIVKYMKVKPLYIQQSPWKKIYGSKYDDILEKYDWYLPAYIPLYIPTVLPNGLTDLKNTQKVIVNIREQMVGHLTTKHSNVNFRWCGIHDFFVLYDNYESTIAVVAFFGVLKQ